MPCAKYLEKKSGQEIVPVIILGQNLSEMIHSQKHQFITQRSELEEKQYKGKKERPVWWEKNQISQKILHSNETERGPYNFVPTGEWKRVLELSELLPTTPCNILCRMLYRSYLISLSLVPQGRCPHFHFTNKETKLQRSRDLTKVSQLWG